MGKIKSIDMIVMGASHGGLEAIAGIFENLSGDFELPVIIVYHRSKQSDHDFFLDYFSRFTALKTLECGDNERIKNGCIYFAPPDYHIMIEDRSKMSLYYDEPVNYSRPSVDILFDSACRVYKNRLMGILLTGANSDGAAGLCSIASEGGLTVVQDPNEAVAPMMPKSALELCKVDAVETLGNIAEIMNLANSYYRESK